MTQPPPPPLSDRIPTIRRATAADADTLARFRVALEEEWTGAPIEPAFRDAIEAWYPRHVGDEALLAWMIDVEGEPVGAGALVLIPRPPYHGNPSGLEALVTSMYVEPGQRRRGLGKALLDAILDHGVKAEVGRFFLYSTPGARSLYGRAGFEPTERAIHMELWPPATELDMRPSRSR